MSDGTLIETADQSMTLLNESEETISKFMQWLYHGSSSLTSYINSDITSKHYMQLAQLYVFAEKWRVLPHLHNLIIDCLFTMRAKQNKDTITMHLVEYIYQNTKRGSSFRTVLVDYMAYHVQPKWYRGVDVAETLAAIPDFAADVAIEFAGRTYNGYTSAFSQPSSKFHKSIKPPKAEDKRSKGSGIREGAEKQKKSG